jgi:ParB family chromosome partitioning protein
MVEDAVRADTADRTDETVADDEVPVAPPVDGAGLTPSTRLRPPGLLELEHLLAEHLDTRVSVQMTAKKGRVTIEFADLEDLERIYRAMTS